MADRPDRGDDAMNPPIYKPDHCPVCGTDVDDWSSNEDHGGESPCPSCGHLLWYVSRVEGDVTMIQLIDNRVVLIELLELLEHAIRDGACGHILINFGGLQQVSSAALGKLVKLGGQAESVRGKLKLCGLHPDLRQVLRITRLDQIFETFDNEAEALASYMLAVG
jgi:anti-sigma B factor antagonist